MSEKKKESPLWNSFYRIVDEDDKYIDWKVQVIDIWLEADGTARAVVFDPEKELKANSIHIENLIQTS